MVAVTYTAHARQWAHGWELHINDTNGDDVGVTQSTTLARAEETVRDYLGTLYDLDEVTDEITIIPEIGYLGERARHAREQLRTAERAQAEAARQSREVARELRRSGLSVTDTAAVLGISRGRVSQLVNS
jgi:DNA-directed RNA polymerase specialized sigma24 family protein